MYSLLYVSGFVQSICVSNQLYCSWGLSGVVWVVHAVNATLATEVANNVPAIPAVKRDSLLDFFIVDSWDNKKMSIFWIDRHLKYLKFGKIKHQWQFGWLS